MKKWLNYCKNNNINPYTATVEEGAEFLGYLFYGREARYGTIATTRSMLSAILPEREGITFGKNMLISRVLKGIFKLRPSLPRHTVMYDTKQVLNYMQSLPDNQELMLELLTLKLCTLLCILSGQRAQTIAALHLDYLHAEQGMYTFYIPKVLKTTTTTFHQTPLEFSSYLPDKRICVVSCLKEYIERTALIRENLEGEKTLILSHTYPNKSVKSATLARYVKIFLGMAGIDLTVFTAHSTRSPSTNKANNIGLSLNGLCINGG